MHALPRTDPCAKTNLRRICSLIVLLTVCVTVFLCPLANAAEQDGVSFPDSEPMQFATTPQGLPADDLGVRDVAFSPDGRLLAVGYGMWTTAGAVRVYELGTRALLHSFQLPKGASSVQFSPDGRWLCAACWDHQIYVWNCDGFPQAAVRVGGTKAIRACFSPDSKWLATASEANELKLWDTTTWEETRTFEGKFRFQHAAFSPDGTLLCAVGGSFENPRFGRAAVFEVASGKQVREMNAGNQPLGGVAFSPDGKSIAAGGFDSILRIWDTASGTERLALRDALGGGAIERVAFSPDGSTLAASGSDSMVRLWNPTEGNLVASIQQPANVLTVAFSPDGKSLACGGGDKMVHVLDSQTHQELFVLHPLSETPDVPSAILAMAASADGKWIATAHEDLTVRLRDASTGKAVRILSGHDDVVAALAFSPDSKHLATGSYDRTVKLWPLDAEAPPLVLKGHTNWVFAVTFSPDGRQLASSGYDKTIRLWDAASGKPLETLTGHTATVRSLAFAPDGKTLVSGSADRTARLWDLASPGASTELKGHEAAIRAVAISPDGAVVATASEDNSVRLWEAAGGKPLRTLSGHQNMVWCLAFSPHGKTLASGGFDNSVRIWDPQSGKSLQELKGHTDVVAALTYAPDSRALLTASYDKTLKRWAAKDPPVPPLADLHVAETGPARFAFVTPDSRTLVTGSGNRHVRFWDLAAGKMTKDLTQRRGINSGAMSRDGKLLLTGDYGSNVTLWDVPQQRMLETIDVGHTNLAAVAISPDNSVLAAGADDGVIVVYDLASHAKLHELPGDGLPVAGLDFSPDGTLLASASGNFKDWRKPGSIKLWSWKEGRELASLPGAKSKMRRVCFTADGTTLLACGSQHEVLVYDVASRSLRYPIATDDEISDVAIFPNGRTLAFGQYKGFVSLWDLQEKCKLAELEGHSTSQDKYVMNVAVSPDGTLVTSAGGDGHVRLWATTPSPPPTPLKALAEVRDDESETYGLAWSPDGKLIATSSKDGTIELRDAKTLKAVLSLTGHAGMVFRVAFAPNGKFLASGGADGTVRLWDTADGRQIVSFDGYGQPMRAIRALAFSPDSRLLAAGNRGGEVFLWDVAEQKLVRELPQQPLTVSGIAFSPDGSLVATSTGIREQWRKPGDVRLWNVQTGEEFARFDGATGEMRSVRFNAAGTRLMAVGLVTLDEGRTAFCKVFLWDLAQRKLLTAYEADTGLTAGVLLPGDKQVVVGNGKGEISIRDLTSGRVLAAATAHDKGVSQIELAPDGTVVASTGLDGMLKLWPTFISPSVSPLVSVRDDPSQSFAVAFSHDGRMLATAGKDRMLRLRDAKSLEVFRTLSGHNGLIYAAAFSPRGEFVASSSSDGTVRLWDVESGQQRSSWDAFRDKRATVRCLAVSPDGKKVAAGNWDGLVRIWDVESGKVLHELPQRSLPVTQVTFSPDGRFLAVSTGNYQAREKPGEVSLWSLADGANVATFTDGHRRAVYDVGFDASGARLLSSSSDGRLCLWDVAQLKLIKQLEVPSGLSQARFLPGQDAILVALQSGSLTVIDTATGQSRVTLAGHSQHVKGIAFSPTQPVVVTAGLDGFVKLWSLEVPSHLAAEFAPASSVTEVVALADVVRRWPNKKLEPTPPVASSKWQAVAVRELSPHGKQVWFAVYSPDGSLLATGGSDRTVRIWDAATFEQKFELIGHTSFPSHAAWSPDGKFLVTAGWDRSVRVWDIGQRKQSHLLEGHSMGVRKVAWSPDRKRLASAGEDGNVIVWDAATFEKQHVLEVGLSAYSVAFSPDGATLAIGNGNYKSKADGRITLWTAASGQRIGELQGSLGYVFHLSYLDKDRLLAANAGEGVTVWNIAQNKPELSYRTPKDVRWVEASRDGHRITAIHYDGKCWLSVWDRDTPTPLVTFSAHDAFGFTAAFSPDGRQIVSGAEDGKLKVWELRPADEAGSDAAEKKQR